MLRNMFRQQGVGISLALVGIFLALGGTSVASDVTQSAVKLVTGKQIKNSSIAGADVKNESLTGGDVKNGSLLSQDFKAGQLPAGAQGPQGERGAQGEQGLPGERGPQGDRGATGGPGISGYEIVEGSPTNSQPGGSKSAEVSCPSGKKVLSAYMAGGSWTTNSGNHPAPPAQSVVLMGVGQTSATIYVGRNNLTDAWGFTPGAVCATVAP